MTTPFKALSSQLPGDIPPGLLDKPLEVDFDWVLQMNPFHCMDIASWIVFDPFGVTFYTLTNFNFPEAGKVALTVTRAHMQSPSVMVWGLYDIRQAVFPFPFLRDADALLRNNGRDGSPIMTAIPSCIDPKEKSPDLFVEMLMRIPCNVEEALQRARSNLVDPLLRIERDMPGGRPATEKPGKIKNEFLTENQARELYGLIAGEKAIKEILPAAMRACGLQ